VVLVRVRATTWVTFGVFAAAAAAMISAWIAAALAGAGLSPVRIGWWLVGLAVAVPVGSRGMWLAYRVDQLRADPGSTLRQVGFVSWGGILCLFGCAAAFGWLAHLDVLRLLDAVAIAGLGGQAVARIGCFTCGCCVRRPRALGSLCCSSCPRLRGPPSRSISPSCSRSPQSWRYVRRSCSACMGSTGGRWGDGNGRHGARGPWARQAARPAAGARRCGSDGGPR